MEQYKGVATFYAESRAAWRKWLAEHHRREQSIWLIMYKKDSSKPSVYYPEAVDEALCFGWIDSKPNKRDDQSYYQFFAKRSEKSNWSKVNKDKIAALIAQNLLQPAGYEMVEKAKENGTWTALDEVEKLILPADLAALFEGNLQAFEHWQGFSRTTKRGILEWIFNAKRPETRLKRVQETVQLAESGRKANQFKP